MLPSEVKKSGGEEQNACSRESATRVGAANTSSYGTGKKPDNTSGTFHIFLISLGQEMKMLRLPVQPPCCKRPR
jgi:hypothetical protein